MSDQKHAYSNGGSFYYASTPAGTMLAHTRSETREGCIAILMADLDKHNMPYPDWEAAAKRGYSVDSWDF